MTRLSLADLEVTPEDFQARCDEADRQGRRHWLWPEVAPDDWRGALDQIERATRDVLVTGRATSRLIGVPLAMCLAGYTSGMGPLLGHWQAAGKLVADAAITPLLDLHLDQNRLRMARLQDEAGAIVDALAVRSIRPVALKGMHTGFAYFPDPATRPMSDIDLLVGPQDARRARDVLEGRGFREVSATDREWTYVAQGAPRAQRSAFLLHAQSNWSIDLHHSLDIRPEPGAARRPLGRGLDIAALPPWTANGNAAALDQPRLLLHLAGHASSALRVNLTLLRLVEIALVVRQDFPGEASWRVLLDLGRACRLLGTCYPAFALCERLVPGTIPPAVLKACKADATAGVRALLATRTPATAQRLDATSVGERYMWAQGPLEIGSQMFRDLFLAVPLEKQWPRYRKLASAALKGRLVR